MGGAMASGTNAIFGDPAQNNYSGTYDYAENQINQNIGQQRDLAQAIQQQAASGASPADIQARQMANQNLAQTQALIGSQRGINPGLAQRQMVQAGSNLNQQAQANMAIQRAQEQIAANQQVGNLYGNIGNQLTGNQSTAAQGSLAQNKANAANAGAVFNATSDIGSMIMGGMAMHSGGKVGYDNGGQVNTNFNSNFGAENSGDPLDNPDGVKGPGQKGGGGGGPMGMISSMFADGGPVTDPREQNFLTLINALAGQKPGALGLPSFNVGDYAPSVQQKDNNNDNEDKPTQDEHALDNVSTQQAGGPGDAGGGMPADTMMASHGGKVPAMVSPGEKYIPPQEAKKVAKGEKSIKDAGKMIPGKAQVKGDSPKNDTVPAKLDQGGIVIPRSVMNSDDPIKEGTEFLKKALRSGSKEEKDFHSALRRAGSKK